MKEYELHQYIAVYPSAMDTLEEKWRGRRLDQTDDSLLAVIELET